MYIVNEAHQKEDMPYSGSRNAKKLRVRCEKMVFKTRVLDPFSLQKKNESFQNVLRALDVDLFILDVFLKAVIMASGQNPIRSTVV